MKPRARHPVTKVLPDSTPADGVVLETAGGAGRRTPAGPPPREGQMPKSFLRTQPMYCAKHSVSRSRAEALHAM